MKQRKTLITTIIYFLLVNTAFLWEGKLGIYAMLSTLLLVLYFFVMAVILIGQVLHSYKENYRNKQRLLLIGLITLVLGTTYLFGGVIDPEWFEDDVVLMAQREGAANCTTTFKLKRNMEFVEYSVCFGTSEIKGNYLRKGDSIFFKEISLGRDETEYYEFAVIKKRIGADGKVFHDLVRFKNYADTAGTPIWITKNEM